MTHAEEVLHNLERTLHLVKVYPEELTQVQASQAIQLTEEIVVAVTDAGDDGVSTLTK